MKHVRFYRFPIDQGDEARAAWMLGLLEHDSNRTALIAMPFAETDEELDAVEGDFIRAYNLARKGRSLGAKVIHGVDAGTDSERHRVGVLLHEHNWIGGHCLNGCTDTREVPWCPPA